MSGAARATLLCCECGQVRTRSAGAAPRNLTMEAEPGSFDRYLEDLKCEACGRITRHAYVRRQGVRDEAEEANHSSRGCTKEDQMRAEQPNAGRVAYSVSEAAAAAGVSTDTIRNAIHGGDLAAYRPRVNGRAIRTVLIDAAELRAWVRAGESV